MTGREGVPLPRVALFAPEGLCFGEPSNRILQLKVTVCWEVTFGAVGYVAFDFGNRFVELIRVVVRGNQETDIKAGVR